MANPMHITGIDSAQACRVDDAGFMAPQNSGLDVRTGVAWGPGTATLVSGNGDTAPMSVWVGTCNWFSSRGVANGPYRGAAESLRTVTLAAAPASGSRIDVVYVKALDNTAGVPSPDGSAGESYAAVTGTSTTGTPVKPALPVGAEELATVTISAGATSTNGAGVVIANTSRQTVARGADVPCRNQAERDALATFPLLTVKRLDTGVIERRNVGNTAWETVANPAAKAPTLSGIELSRSTASGGNISLPSSATTAVTFAAGQVTRDVGGFYTGSGATIATVPAGYAGLYSVTVVGEFDGSGAPTDFFLEALVNGTTRACRASSPDRATGSAGAIRLAVGDTLSMNAFQNIGTTRNLISARLTAHLISL